MKRFMIAIFSIILLTACGSMTDSKDDAPVQDDIENQNFRGNDLNQNGNMRNNNIPDNGLNRQPFNDDRMGPNENDIIPNDNGIPRDKLNEGDNQLVQ